MARSVAIYREALLPASETFVVAQGESMRRYTPTYVGTHRVAGLTTPPERTVLLTNGPAAAVRRRMLAATGWSPGATARLRAVGPNLVHAHFGLDAARVLPLTRRLGLPLVASFHGWDATTSEEMLRRGPYGHRQLARERGPVLAAADLVLAVSGHIRDRLLALGADPERVRCHYIGIDTDFWSPSPEAVGPEASRLVFVGRLVPVKGVGVLIRALARLSATGTAPALVIIGDGPQRRDLEALAAESRVDVEFRGTLDASAVRAEVRRASGLVAPSVSIDGGIEEALNLTSLEAQACGVPVVVSRSGGLPETVVDGRTGFVVPPDDPDALAAAIRRLIDDRNTQQQMGSAARDMVVERFDLHRQTAVLEDLYDRLAEAVRTPASS
jgi:glycosyltransferase involved in cell wall biosynthesis